MLWRVVWRSCFAGCFTALWTCSPRISSHPRGEQLRVRLMSAISAASVMLWCAANDLLFFAWVTGRHLCLIKQIKDDEIIQETRLWWGIRIDLFFSAAAQAERRKHRRARVCQFSFQLQVRIAAGTVKHGQLIRSLHESEFALSFKEAYCHLRISVVSFRIRPGCSHKIYSYLTSHAEIERRNVHLEPKNGPSLTMKENWGFRSWSGPFSYIIIESWEFIAPLLELLLFCLKRPVELN